jgi:hypothetical protein
MDGARAMWPNVDHQSLQLNAVKKYGAQCKVDPYNSDAGNGEESKGIVTVTAQDEFALGGTSVTFAETAN